MTARLTLSWRPTRPPSPHGRQVPSEALRLTGCARGPQGATCPCVYSNTEPPGTGHCGLHTPEHLGRPAAPPQCPRGHTCLLGAIQGEERLSLVTGAPPPSVRA